MLFDLVFVSYKVLEVRGFVTRVPYFVSYEVCFQLLV